MEVSLYRYHQKRAPQHSFASNRPRQRLVDDREVSSSGVMLCRCIVGVLVGVLARVRMKPNLLRMLNDDLGIIRVRNGGATSKEEEVSLRRRPGGEVH